MTIYAGVLTTFAVLRLDTTRCKTASILLDSCDFKFDFTAGFVPFLWVGAGANVLYDWVVASHK